MVKVTMVFVDKPNSPGEVAMNNKLMVLAFVATGFALSLNSQSLQAAGKADMILSNNDSDGDGRISKKEWPKKPSFFKKIDANEDGYLSREELENKFGGSTIKQGKSGMAPPVAPAVTSSSPGDNVGLNGKVPIDEIDYKTVCGIGRGMKCDIKVAIKLGLFETGLRPKFPEGLDCRDIDEQYAISYTSRRSRENYHGGIDMPAPWGTPMIAAADGTVVGKYVGTNSYRGKEIILRHSPEDTGIPLWIYTQYSHFDKMPEVELGQRVRMGDNIGPTGNSGRGKKPGVQNPRRRPAIHFGVFFASTNKFAETRGKIIPVKGLWMDPNALFIKSFPLDSYSLKALPESQKKVPIAIKTDDGEIIPANAKIIWPYTCSRN